MKKILTRSMEKVTKIAKKAAEESPNTVSAFLYYEPNAPKKPNKYCK